LFKKVENSLFKNEKKKEIAKNVSALETSLLDYFITKVFDDLSNFFACKQFLFL
jgi:hypothetical protein